MNKLIWDALGLGPHWFVPYATATLVSSTVLIIAIITLFARLWRGRPAAERPVWAAFACCVPFFGLSLVAAVVVNRDSALKPIVTAMSEPDLAVKVQNGAVILEGSHKERLLGEDVTVVKQAELTYSEARELGSVAERFGHSWVASARVSLIAR